MIIFHLPVVETISINLKNNFGLILETGYFWKMEIWKTGLVSWTVCMWHRSSVDNVENTLIKLSFRLGTKISLSITSKSGAFPAAKIFLISLLVDLLRFVRFLIGSEFVLQNWAPK